MAPTTSWRRRRLCQEVWNHGYERAGSDANSPPRHNVDVETGGRIDVDVSLRNDLGHEVTDEGEVERT